MTASVLLDTHVVLWLDSGDRRLPTQRVDRLMRHWAAGGTLLVSAISVLEIAQLASRGRIRLDLPIRPWIDRFLARPGIETLPVTHDVALEAYNLPGLPHADPADRLLIASAIDRRCALMTFDGNILAYAQQHGRQSGFSVFL